MRKRSRRSGFTIIELSLSIVFISVLSLAVVLIITNSISAYRRGLTLNQINTVGMELVDDMRAAVQNAPVLSISSMCEMEPQYCRGGEQDLVARRRRVNTLTLGEQELRNVPMSGVLCTGNYSYIWNSGYFFNNDAIMGGVGIDKATLKYLNKDGAEEQYSGDFRLLKVKDEGRTVCKVFNPDSGEINMAVKENNNYKFDLVPEDPYDLLASEEGNLALFDLYAPVPAMSLAGNNVYYSVSFVLGTLLGGANVMANTDYCATPEGVDNAAIENFDYCSINKFNFAAEAIGGGE